MDMAILQRRKFQLKVNRALMRMAFLQWRKFKLEAPSTVLPEIDPDSDVDT